MEKKREECEDVFIVQDVRRCICITRVHAVEPSVMFIRFAFLIGSITATCHYVSIEECDCAVGEFDGVIKECDGAAGEFDGVIEEYDKIARIDEFDTFVW